MGRSNAPFLIVLLIVAIGLGAKFLALGPFAKDEVAATPTPPVAAAPTTPNAGVKTTPISNGTTKQAKKAKKAKTPSPLVLLSKNQRRQLIDVNVKLAVLLDGRSTTQNHAAQRSATRKACRHLDTRSGLLAALNLTCPPAFSMSKMAGSVHGKCSTDFDACLAIGRRYADATLDFVSASRDYVREVKAAVPAGACRKALLPTKRELRDLKHAATVLYELSAAGENMDLKALARHAKRLKRLESKGKAVNGPAFRRQLHKACRA